MVALGRASDSGMVRRAGTGVKQVANRQIKALQHFAQLWTCTGFQYKIIM